LQLYWITHVEVYSNKSNENSIPPTVPLLRKIVELLHSNAKQGGYPCQIIDQFFEDHEEIGLLLEFVEAWLNFSASMFSGSGWLF
jgi:hypothetical protein